MLNLSCFTYFKYRYRGILPPLGGSLIFRSMQFSVNNGVYGMLKDTSLDTNIPFTSLNFKIVCGGMVAGAARAVVETPLEFIKVRRQTGQSWMIAPTLGETLRQPMTQMRALYTGLGVTLTRTSLLMTSFVIMCDYLLRYFPEVMTADYIGPFVKGGLCSTAAWWIVWPMENIKNQMVII
jgi:solute carrier family 25 carnitine/acylcarnitine transporter 20/29